MLICLKNKKIPQQETMSSFSFKEKAISFSGLIRDPTRQNLNNLLFKTSLGNKFYSSFMIKPELEGLVQEIALLSCEL